LEIVQSATLRAAELLGWEKYIGLHRARKKFPNLRDGSLRAGGFVVGVAKRWPTSVAAGSYSPLIVVRICHPLERKDTDPDKLLRLRSAISIGNVEARGRRGALSVLRWTSLVASGPSLESPPLTPGSFGATIPSTGNIGPEAVERGVSVHRWTLPWWPRAGTGLSARQRQQSPPLTPG
jgi:hypothetical protein